LIIKILFFLQKALAFRHVFVRRLCFDVPNDSLATRQIQGTNNETFFQHRCTMLPKPIAKHNNDSHSRTMRMSMPGVFHLGIT